MTHITADITFPDKPVRCFCLMTAVALPVISINYPGSIVATIAGGIVNIFQIIMGKRIGVIGIIMTGFTVPYRWSGPLCLFVTVPAVLRFTLLIYRMTGDTTMAWDFG